MLVARPRVGRQDKVGECLGSERSRVTEAAHLTELQPRKKRIGIEDHSLLAVREVDRDETPRPARALSRADQVAPMQFASDQNILGKSEEHTSELQSLMRISYAVFCLQKQ